MVPAFLRFRPGPDGGDHGCEFPGVLALAHPVQIGVSAKAS
jgi:hypothetical protein